MQTETSSSASGPAPTPSSSVILVRDGKEGIELFVVRRNAQMRFAAGATAFPGGALDQQDIDLAMRMNADDDILPFKINAIRELFEETGLLLASYGNKGQTESQVQRQSNPLIPASDAIRLLDYRQPLLDQTLSFDKFLSQHNLTLELNLLSHFSKWLAPKIVRRRFVTDFFLAREPADQQSVFYTGELDAAYWCSLKTLMSQLQAGEINMMFPTEMNCLRLMQFSDVAAVFSSLPKHAPFIEPSIKSSAEGKFLCAPPEAGVGKIRRKLPSM